MRVKNIASGSSGNVTYICGAATHILVDVGVSKKRITSALSEEGLSLYDIGAILITHEHIDHISALGVIERAASIPVYATKGTIEGIKECRSLGDFDTEVFHEIKPGETFTVGGMSICPIEISHDANEPVCYKFEADKKKFAIVTDLGTFDRNLVEKLKGIDGILVEANHDVRMLEAGPYPYPLKRRILGDRGHLSNELGAGLLNAILHPGLKTIILGHLSKENNDRELARLAVRTEIDMADNGFSADDFDIEVAWRERPSHMTEI